MAKTKPGSSILKFDTVKAQARAAKQEGKSILELKVEQRFVPPGLIEKVEQTTFALPVLLVIERPDQPPLQIGSRDYTPPTASTTWAKQNAWGMRMQHKGQKGLLLLDMTNEYSQFLPLKVWVDQSPLLLVQAIQEAIGAEGVEEVRSMIEDLSSMEMGCLKVEWVRDLPIGELWTYHYMEPEDKQQIAIEEVLWDGDSFSYAFPIVYSKPELVEPQSLDDRYGMVAIPEWVRTAQQAWGEKRPATFVDELFFEFEAFLP